MTSGLWKQWQTSLRLRPLLWLTPCLVGGSILGLRYAAAWDNVALSVLQAFCLALFLFACAALTFSLYYKPTWPLLSRVALGICCICLMCSYTAWLASPPPNDISRLAMQNNGRTQPLQAPHVTLRGYIADHPQRGEFSIQFPLDCHSYDLQHQQNLASRSFIWITAPPDTLVEVGDAVEVQGELQPLNRATNPGQREEHWYFVLKRCWSRLVVKEPAQFKAQNTLPRYAFKRKIAKWRLALLKHYENAFRQRGGPYPHANAQLLTAMVFGEGGLSHPLPSLIREEFRLAGLSHVLVASGSQIAFGVALLLGLGKLLGLRGKWLLALVIPLLFLYAALAGGAPSILRATVAGVLVTIAVLTGRETDPLSLWCAALLALVVIDPVQLMSLSLQLSFAAAWGLIALTPPLKRILVSCFGQNTIAAFTAFSLAAQLGVLPILLYHFGQFSLAGIGANLLGIPLAGVLVTTGIGGLVFPLAWLNGWLIQNLTGTATFFSKLHGTQMEHSPLQLQWVIVYYAIVVGFISLAGIQLNNAMQQAPPQAGSSSRRSWRDDWLMPLFMEFNHWRQRVRVPNLPMAALLLCIATLLLASVVFYQNRPQPFRLTMLDVGQGESLVAQSPEQKVILVDGGGDVSGWRTDVGRSVIVPYLQTNGIKKIDILVLTHTDADHCNGLQSVLREVPVDLVIDGTSNPDPAAVEYYALRKELARRKIPVMQASAGYRRNLGTTELEVLAPFPPTLPGDNNNSVVLRLTYGQTSFLLTGDIEELAEERLTRRGVNLQSTILKAAHHGSSTSTTPAILNAVRPQAALISCGRYNQFGHPSGEVLRRLDAAGIPTLRTDLDGAIDVFSDGKQCWIETSR